MKDTTLLVVWMCGLLACASQLMAENPAPNVIPAVREWRGDAGNFTVGANPKICVSPGSDAGLSGIAGTFQRELGLLGIRVAVATSDSPAAGDFHLTKDCHEAGLGNEGYLLNVGDFVRITSTMEAGIIHGTISVLQILQQNKTDKIIPKGVAKDYPRYQIRGQMLDPARSFIPLERLEEIIRTLGWYKYNELHLHLTDLEGFRIESATYPGLASNPSYSRAEMSGLIQYAARYGIQVMPEIEMPSHIGMTKYFGKDLCTGDYTGKYAEFNNMAFDFSKGSVTNPNGDDPKTSIYAISKNLIGENAALFPYSYFHIGGDEWPHWPPAIQSRTNEAVTVAADSSPSQKAHAAALGYSHTTDLYAGFVNFANAQARSNGKVTRMWSWDQHIQQFLVKIDPNHEIVYDLWNYRPEEGGVAAYVKANRKIVNCSPLYLYNDIGACRPAGELYEKWTPNRFSTECYTSFSYMSEDIDPEYPNLLGAKAQNWGGASMKPRMQPLAEILWCGSKQSADYHAFCERLKAIGEPVDDSAKDGK